jgi:hypothetical protein
VFDGNWVTITCVAQADRHRCHRPRLSDQAAAAAAAAAALLCTLRCGVRWRHGCRSYRDASQAQAALGRAGSQGLLHMGASQRRRDADASPNSFCWVLKLAALLACLFACGRPQGESCSWEWPRGRSAVAVQPVCRKGVWQQRRPQGRTPRRTLWPLGKTSAHDSR